MTTSSLRKSLTMLVAILAMTAMSAGCSGSVSGGVGEVSVDQADLEQGVSAELEAVVGQTPASVACEDDLPAEIGAQVRCTVTADDGSEIGATVTVDEVDGTDVKYSVEVDED
ncbi:MAG: DUF4333 domain-containing protein [Microthrixaceae bacterium]